MWNNVFPPLAVTPEHLGRSFREITKLLLATRFISTRHTGQCPACLQECSAILAATLIMREPERITTGGANKSRGWTDRGRTSLSISTANFASVQRREFL